MAFMLFHLPRPTAGLAEAWRVLRPGGSVGLLTWGTERESRARRQWVEELDAAGAGEVTEKLSWHGLVNTPQKVNGELQAAGFTVAVSGRVVRRTAHLCGVCLPEDEARVLRAPLGVTGARAAAGAAWERLPTSGGADARGLRGGIGGDHHGGSTTRIVRLQRRSFGVMATGRPERFARTDQSGPSRRLRAPAGLRGRATRADFRAGQAPPLCGSPRCGSDSRAWSGHCGRACRWCAG
jgi:hypothetical protein